jgi:glycerate 2-kinase
MKADAQAIWQAAIAAVRPEHLLVDLGLPLDNAERIVVVGGGKAAAGMAAGVEAALDGPRLAVHDLRGLVSVPAGCGRRLARIEVRETRPAGVNLPTPAVVAATEEMLGVVGALGPRDLAIAVITGGGSALLAAPRPGITLEETIAVTTRLSESGASIAALNAARRELSVVKGGGLARACGAGRLLALVLSDVIGDDLDVIASGPCMPPQAGTDGSWTTPAGCRVEHRIVGGNATAVVAAAAAARGLGYEVVGHGAPAEATAEATGRALAAAALAMQAECRRDGRPRALVSGGEATVVVPVDHGRGGRNQQTVLAAIDAVIRDHGHWPGGLVIASVGTDGEDGPTDAAGACADAEVVGAIAAGQLDLWSALARCDAYPLLSAAGGLVRTGPTGTNVADVRLVLCR